MELQEILRTWDQAGEQPYLVLQKLGIYDDFLNYITSIDLNGPIYRGTRRHGELNVGDILDYTKYPTSWTTNELISSYFITDIANPVILKLITNNPVYGIINTENTYNEEEVILAPLYLKVIQREIVQSQIIRLTVIPM